MPSKSVKLLVLPSVSVNIITCINPHHGMVIGKLMVGHRTSTGSGLTNDCLKEPGVVNGVMDDSVHPHPSSAPEPQVTTHNV